jgi:uncharacterized membrane protein YebE (DUF533 family)
VGSLWNLNLLRRCVLMKVSDQKPRESSKHLESQEAVDLEKLKARVEQAIADGYLSRSERDDIMRRIYADRRVSVEECEILRLLQNKIWEGEIQID